MQYIEFPDGVLDLSFYRGITHISELIISYSKFNRMPSVGTCSTMCQDLRVLRIYGGELNEYHDIDIFPKHLHELSIVNVNIIKLNPRYLEKHIYHLHWLSISYLPDGLDMQTTFPKVPGHSWLITNLGIGSNSNKFHVLAADNFTNLRHLENLDLSDCGIRVIEDNAFDPIYGTLQHLILNRNKFTTINYRMFYKWFESSPSENININLLENILDCSCDYFELLGIGKWIGYSFKHGRLRVHMDCFYNNESGTNRFSCSALQIIHPRKFCIPDFHVQSYQYPKFTIKFNERLKSIVIKTDSSRKYRLWIHSLISLSEFNAKWGFTNRKCPKTGFIQSSVQCLLLSGPEQHISLPGFHNEANFMQICVSYVAAETKKIWPLHCITHIKDRSDKYFNIIHTFKWLLWFLVPCLMGIGAARVIFHPLYFIIGIMVECPPWISGQADIESEPVAVFTMFENCEPEQYESIREYEYVSVVDGVSILSENALENSLENIYLENLYLEY